MNQLTTHDYWLTVAIETSGAWPVEERPLTFRGRELLLIPETKELAQRVAIRCPSSNEGLDALRVVRQFLSAFAWVERCPVHELFNGGTSRPANLRKGPAEALRPWPVVRQFSHMFYYDYLPEPPDPRAWLALALFREALNVKSVHYRFLSYYKIINILHERGMPGRKKRGPAQVTWINQTLPSLEDWDTNKRLQELQQQVANVGEYLYVSGRCAIAHAFAKPVADPDDPKDTMRLSQDLPLVAALAEYAIENEFRVKSAKTIRKQHLYELAGFHAIVGTHWTQKLKSKAPVDLSALPQLPRLFLRATRLGDVIQLPAMSAERLAANDGCLTLQCSSADGLMHAQLLLHFPEERLGFDPEDDVVCYDDGSATAVEYALLSLNLFENLLLNGRVEVWNAETSRCLGKTNAFIPRNVDVRRTLRNNAALRNKLETLLWVRRSPFVTACDI